MDGNEEIYVESSASPSMTRSCVVPLADFIVLSCCGCSGTTSGHRHMSCFDRSWFYSGESYSDSASLVIQTEKASSTRKVVRLAAATDEGPDNIMLMCFLQSQGCCVVNWTDPAQRIHNCSTLGAKKGDVNFRKLYKSVERVYKLTRGPWHGHTFGKQLRTAGRKLAIFQ
jgi:hypothetical protein